MKYPKKIETAISQAKRTLISKAKKNGIYENFGESEINDIENHYIDISVYTASENLKRQKLNEFCEWCYTFDLSNLY